MPPTAIDPKLHALASKLDEMSAHISFVIANREQAESEARLRTMSDVQTAATAEKNGAPSMLRELLARLLRGGA